MISKLFAIAVLIVLASIAVEMRSVQKIGKRIPGDRLIVTDKLPSPTTTDTPMNHTISFRYPITMVITCISLESDANVFAEFVLSLDSILHGVITAVDALEFNLKVSVYGIDYKAAPKDFISPLIPKSRLKGILSSTDDDSNDIYEYEDYDEVEDLLETEIITIGDRQEGDELVFQDFQSSVQTDERTSHQVIFRFIDSYFLTQLQLKTFEKPNSKAVLSQVSDHSMKATIQADNVTSLDVECKIFGIRSDTKPENYEPFVANLENIQFLGLGAGVNIQMAYSSIYGLVLGHLIRWLLV